MDSRQPTSEPRLRAARTRLVVVCEACGKPIEVVVPPPTRVEDIVRTVGNRHSRCEDAA
jgi:hypothetical protein